MTPRLITELGIAISCILTNPGGHTAEGYITLNRYELQRSSGDVAVQFVPVCHLGDVSKFASIDIEELTEWQRDGVELLRDK
jgi:hypothetical protein